MVQQSQALEFALKQQLLGFIIGDLEKLMDQSPDERGEGGCEVPAAGIMFFTMEVLGACLSKDVKGLSSAEHLRNFIDIYMPGIPDNDSEELVDYFWPLLRQAFLPIRGLASFHSVKKKPEAEELILRNGQSSSVLNLSRFYDHFHRAAGQLTEDILSSPDSTVARNFYANVQLFDSSNAVPATRYLSRTIVFLDDGDSTGSS